MRKTASESEKKSELAPLPGFVEVPLDRIVGWLEGQRETNEEKVEALAASMKEVGQRSPITVARRWDGTFLGVDGGHRFAAAKVLKWTHLRAEVVDQEVRAEVIEPETEARLLLARFHANKFRLELDPVQEAEEAARILAVERRINPKAKQQDVARRLGFDPGTFSQLLDLSDLPKPVKELMRDGRLKPSHGAWIHAALEKPEPGIPPEAWTQKIVNVATDAATRGTDVKTAREEIENPVTGLRVRVRREVEAREREAKAAAEAESRTKAEAELAVHRQELIAAFEKALKRSKAKVCPGPDGAWERGDPPDSKCRLTPSHFDDVLAEKGRFVGICPHGANEGQVGHRWDLATGKLDLTPMQRKELAKLLKERARQTAAALAAEKKELREDRREATEAETAERTAAKKEHAVQWDVAFVHLRAPREQWLDAIHGDAGQKGFGTRGTATEFTLDCDGFDIAAQDLLKGLPEDVRIHFTPENLSDGKGGKFLLRAQIGRYSSSSTDQDSIVADAPMGDWKWSFRKDFPIWIVRDVRARLLKFQAERVGVRQKADEIFPVEVAGFRVGETVRLSQSLKAKGYRGARAPILAFDRKAWVNTYSEEHSWVKSEDALVALLALNRPSKRFPVAALEKIEAKPKTKGGKGKSKPPKKAKGGK